MNTISKLDPAWGLRRIPLAAISIDPSVQQRVAGTARDLVAEYAEAMRAGEKFPPLVVFTNDNVTFHLSDGFHRENAYRLAYPDALEIECEVHPGGRPDALLFACGANAAHGRQRSHLDKRQAVLSLLRDDTWSQWSDREIGRQCWVSHILVATVRKAHLETLPDAGVPEDSAPVRSPARPAGRRRTVTRGGKVYRMKTARIGTSRKHRAKDADRPPLTSRSWSSATKAERLAFVNGVGREIFDLCNHLEPGIHLNRAWIAATDPERLAFAREHFGELQTLVSAPEPIRKEPWADMAADPLAIPTFLQRGHPDCVVQSPSMARRTR
jgi:hypothetical protein